MAYSSRKRFLLSLARVWSAPLFWWAGRSANSDTIRIDVNRWIECLGNDSLVPMNYRDRFAYLSGALPEFRTVVHIRIADLPLPVRLVLKRVYPPHPWVVIEAASIGPGLFIHHGIGTIVSAEAIGRNFWVNQHVSLGYTKHGRPTVGDDVTVAAGAVVVGPISVGDNSFIGANAVVSADVAANSLVTANPPTVRLTELRRGAS
jgi:serine O-acetyltransferase